MPSVHSDIHHDHESTLIPANFPNSPQLMKQAGAVHTQYLPWSPSQVLSHWLLPSPPLQPIPALFPAVLRPLLGAWHAQRKPYYQNPILSFSEVVLQPDYTLTNQSFECEGQHAVSEQAQAPTSSGSSAAAAASESSSSTSGSPAVSPLSCRVITRGAVVEAVQPCRWAVATDEPTPAPGAEYRHVLTREQIWSTLDDSHTSLLNCENLKSKRARLVLFTTGSCVGQRDKVIWNPGMPPLWRRSLGRGGGGDIWIFDPDPDAQRLLLCFNGGGYQQFSKGLSPWHP